MVDIRVLEFFISHNHISDYEAKNLIEDIRSRYHYDVDALGKEFPFSKRDFMEFICDVDVSIIPKNKELKQLLEKMTQAKFILTDTTKGHLLKVLSSLGIQSELFTAIFDSHDMNYNFKYRPESFILFLNKYNFQSHQCVLFEDSINNLQIAKDIGFTTVLVNNTNCDEPKYVDYVFSDIVVALRYLKNNFQK